MPVILQIFIVKDTNGNIGSFMNPKSVVSVFCALAESFMRYGENREFIVERIVVLRFDLKTRQLVSCSVLYYSATDEDKLELLQQQMLSHERFGSFGPGQDQSERFKVRSEREVGSFQLVVQSVTTYSTFWNSKCIMVSFCVSSFEVRDK